MDKLMRQAQAVEHLADIFVKDEVLTRMSKVEKDSLDIDAILNYFSEKIRKNLQKEEQIFFENYGIFCALLK